MNKTFKRFIAYIIDIFVITLIVQSLAGIPQLNRQLDKYNKYYRDYVKVTTKYYNFKGALLEDYKDKELTEEEYERLTRKNPNYKEVLDKYYKDNKLSNSNYNKLIKELDSDYQNTYKELTYKIDKNSYFYFVIYIVVVLAYFVGFNKYTNGQTLGKKLMRLRIVNSKDNEKEVSTINYLIRAVILYQVIVYLARLIGVSTLDINSYYDIVNVVSTIQSYLEIAIILVMMIRIDGRGIHDLLSSTRVAMYNKQGEEVYDKLDMAVQEMKRNKNTSK